MDSYALFPSLDDFSVTEYGDIRLADPRFADVTHVSGTSHIEYCYENEDFMCSIDCNPSDGLWRWMLIRKSPFTYMDDSNLGGMTSLTEAYESLRGRYLAIHMNDRMASTDLSLSEHLTPNTPAMTETVAMPYLSPGYSMPEDAFDLVENDSPRPVNHDVNIDFADEYFSEAEPSGQMADVPVVVEPVPDVQPNEAVPARRYRHAKAEASSQKPARPRHGRSAPSHATRLVPDMNPQDDMPDELDEFLGLIDSGGLMDADIPGMPDAGGDFAGESFDEMVDHVNGIYESFQEQADGFVDYVPPTKAEPRQQHPQSTTMPRNYPTGDEIDRIFESFMSADIRGDP